MAEPSGQKLPLGQGYPACAVALLGEALDVPPKQTKPAGHGKHCRLLGSAEYVPAGHGRHVASFDRPTAVTSKPAVRVVRDSPVTVSVKTPAITPPVSFTEGSSEIPRVPAGHTNGYCEPTGQ